ncbi:LytTR family transcriptional regulator DNA-binding domain-containing protein [Polaribacter sp. BAL334]|uniref:LytR/AlgR family response regulator transcription factor n=1 Tax=Polaribacter sp. BAL334 TaxID=1708178 RepID=UPI0018D26EC1|nr:LytTR family DNA-binding domain-containing protein [Polaribacter sp. BAL334]MBG7611145.1 LytTR family transcriptional regulator DNA-binding domain-containing protein [Polaribacter sp. BAL334]
MKKDRLYFLTFIAITIVFLFVAIIASQYFIKLSANQLIEAQVESSKREANEIAKMLDFQLESEISKEKIIENLQQIIDKTDNNSWFISVFDWGGKEVCNPDKTKVGQLVNSDQSLLLSLNEKNNSDNLYDLLTHANINATSEIIYIVPLKKTDLIVAANVQIKSINNQLKALKINFHLIFLIMGLTVIVLSFFLVRIIGSAYEKELEQQNSSLTTEVVNLSKLNSDLFSYKEKVAISDIKNTSDDSQDKEKKRLLTYIRNELVPILIDDIAYVYTENSITFVVSFDGNKSISNASLDEVFTQLNPSLFFRANRQFIISISAIDKILKYGNSQLKIVLHTKTTEDIIISKNKAAEFKQWLNM